MPSNPAGTEPSLRSEADLRASLRRAPGICVLTGGQTGVDTIAALAALDAGLAAHLVFTRGFRQEDGSLTQSRRDALRGAMLHELTSPEFAYRTWTCVYLADGVILVDPAGGAGCRETARAAACLGRPLLDLSDGRGGPGSPAGLAGRYGTGLARGTGSAAGTGLAGRAGLAEPGAVGPSEIASWLELIKARVLMVAGCRGSVLADADCEGLAASQVADAIAGARQRQDQALS
jgi:hypothetical protein